MGGRLTAKEMEVSGWMAQMWTNFAIEGHPGFGIEPWDKTDPQYLRIDDTVTIQVDYRALTTSPRTRPGLQPQLLQEDRHVDLQDLQLQSMFPGHYCPDGWDLYEATSNDGTEHRKCFWFGNVDEQVSHDDAKRVCNTHNGYLAEVPLGPNLNHWIVEKLLQKTDRLNSEGQPRRPVWETQYWLGGVKANGEWRWESDNSAIQWFDWGDGEPNNLNGQNCLTYMLYEDIFGFRDFNWNDWDCDTAADFICERNVD